MASGRSTTAPCYLLASMNATSGSMADRPTWRIAPRRQPSATRPSPSLQRHPLAGCIITGDSETVDAPRLLLAHRAFGTLPQCQWPCEVLPMSPVYSVTYVAG